jgi:hypothetical protein
MTASRVSRLQGHLNVLLAVREELRAIGASDARRESNRRQIAEVRARLLDGRCRRETGDLTDAT